MSKFRKILITAGLVFLAVFLVACGESTSVAVIPPTVPAAAPTNTTAATTTVAGQPETTAALVALPSVTPVPATTQPAAPQATTAVSQGDPVLPPTTAVSQGDPVLPPTTAGSSTTGAAGTTAPVIKISPRPVISATIAPIAIGWKEYVYTQTNYSIQFPALPEFKETSESTAIGPFNTFTYTVKQSNQMTYTVTVLQQPSRVFNLLDPGGLLALEKQKDKFLATYRNFPKLSETPIFAGIYHGRRMNFEGGNGKLAFVYAVVAPRDSDLFMITVESTQNSPENLANAKKFIESVQLRGEVYDWAQLNLAPIKVKISLPVKAPIQATFSETLPVGGVVKGTTYTAQTGQGISYTVTALEYPANLLAEDKISKSFNSQRDKLIGKLKAKISSQESITWANQYAGTYYDLDRPERGGFTKVQMFQKGNYIYILQLDSVKELPPPASPELLPLHAVEYQRFFLSFDPQ